MVTAPTVDKLLKEINRKFVFVDNLCVELSDKQLNNEMTPDMYNFYMSDSDQIEIISTIEKLYEKETNAAKAAVQGLLDVHNFDGTYIELKTYRWLLDNEVKFKPQIEKVTIHENKSILDGKFTDTNVYFDVKSFNLTTPIINEFIFALNEKYPGHFFTFEGPRDSSYKEWQKIMKKKYNHIRKFSNANRNSIKINNVRINRHKKVPGVYTSESTFDPFQWAQNNEEFFLKNCKQYTPDHSFILICTMTKDILGFEKFVALRALARRAFINLRKRKDEYSKIVDDYKQINDKYKDDIPDYLSAIIFLDFSPHRKADNEEIITDGKNQRIWNKRAYMFCNPNAKHRINHFTLQRIFGFQYLPLADKSYVEDFLYDNY